MSLYESIFKRKSLRKYSMISLDEETIHKVNSMMRNLPVLEKSCSMDLVFIRDGDSLAKKMSPFSKVAAPHYIVATGTKNESCLFSAGYAMEHLVLMLTEIGLGTCYLGHALDKVTAISTLGLRPDEDVLITLALGKALIRGDEVHNPSEHRKRETFEHLMLEGIPDPDQRLMIEAARLAPSYMNSQGWRFSVVDGEIRLHKKSSDFLRNRFLGISGYFDMGVALCHMEVAARHLGYGTRLVFDDSVESAAEYIQTLKLLNYKLQ